MARVHRDATRSGDLAAAAHAAFWVAFSFFDRGEVAQASGWLRRGQAAVGANSEPCPARGYLLALEAIQLVMRGDAKDGLRLFTEVHDCGREFADPDLLALGRLGQGQALVILGEVEQGAACLDEVMVAVTAEELSAVVSGLVYCQVIETCHRTFDVARAREWTGALTRWCEAQPDLVPYRGDCLVHRAQIMQLNGDWARALTEAEHAGRLLATLPRNPLQGAALYEKGEVHRLRGELNQAEDCYRAAGELGHEIQPGLTLLRLAQGLHDAAQAGIRRALDETKAPIIRPGCSRRRSRSHSPPPTWPGPTRPRRSSVASPGGSAPPSWRLSPLTRRLPCCSRRVSRGWPSGPLASPGTSGSGWASPSRRPAAASSSVWPASGSVTSTRQRSS